MHRRRWQIADLTVLGLWTAVVSFTLAHHEKWADEAQAWLLAKDLSLPYLWLKELRYEGTPGLWHTMLWVAQHWFHLPYSSIGVIGMLCALAGVAFLLFKAPFPRPLRWMLAFSYFIVYQYAVLARQYDLFALFAFSAAYFFPDTRRPERFTLAIILLANTSFHGTVFAFWLGLAYAWQLYRGWSGLGEPVRKRAIYCGVVLSLVYIFLFLVLKPPADVEALQGLSKMTREILFFYVSNAIAGPILDDLALSCVFLLLLGLWFVFRKRLLLYLATLISLVGLYIYSRAWPHHQGTMFLAIITLLWISWPTTAETQAFARWDKHRYHAVLGLMVVLFSYHIFNAAMVIKHEYEFPYSGAEDCARYLKSVGADHRRIYGVSYSRVAVQAYFDHNIFYNAPTIYFHHSSDQAKLAIVPDDLKSKPEYVVLHVAHDEQPYTRWDKAFLLANGYTPVHFSNGVMLVKSGWVERQVYITYRRNDVDSSAPLAPQ